MSKDKLRREDKSVHIPQKNKIRTDLSIRNFPWTERQKKLIEIIQTKSNTIVMVKGPAGSAKSLIAIYCALEALNSRKIGEIVYVRSVVESSSHSMGFLPGSSEDKMNPYLQPMCDKLEELLEPSQVKWLVNEGKVRGLPINFMRGLSINTAFIVGDEMQNFTVKEILTLATRVGKFSKLILLGDIRQTDVKDSGFEKVFNAFDNQEAKDHGIYTFSFGLEDIMRSEVVKYIVQRFEQIK